MGNKAIGNTFQRCTVGHALRCSTRELTILRLHAMLCMPQSSRHLSWCPLDFCVGCESRPALSTDLHCMYTSVHGARQWQKHVGYLSIQSRPEETGEICFQRFTRARSLRSLHRRFRTPLESPPRPVTEEETMPLFLPHANECVDTSSASVSCV